MENRCGPVDQMDATDLRLIDACHGQNATRSMASTRIVLASNAPSNPGPYKRNQQETYAYVPPLILLCLKRLSEFPEQVHLLHPTRLTYRPADNPTEFDIVRALAPNPDVLDPRLWATLAQVYEGLPDRFLDYRIPLDDEHLPLLQKIPSTPSFSLVTILDLSATPTAIKDTNIYLLRTLVTLVALDLSHTPITNYGVQSLANTIHYDEEYKGPFALRIIRLIGCRKITADIFPILSKFPLLSIVDLRQTSCRNPCPSGFVPSSNTELFNSPLPGALALLNSQTPLFPSVCYFSLQINSLGHPRQPIAKRIEPSSLPGASQNGYVVLGRTGGPQVGNTDTLEWIEESIANHDAHERNKAAWYERHPEALSLYGGSDLGEDSSGSADLYDQYNEGLTDQWYDYYGGGYDYEDASSEGSGKDDTTLLEEIGIRRRERLNRQVTSTTSTSHIPPPAPAHRRLDKTTQPPATRCTTRQPSSSHPSETFEGDRHCDVKPAIVSPNRIRKEVKPGRHLSLVTEMPSARRSLPSARAPAEEFTMNVLTHTSPDFGASTTANSSTRTSSLLSVAATAMSPDIYPQHKPYGGSEPPIPRTNALPRTAQARCEGAPHVPHAAIPSPPGEPESAQVTAPTEITPRPEGSRGDSDLMSDIQDRVAAAETEDAARRLGVATFYGTQPRGTFLSEKSARNFVSPRLLRSSPIDASLMLYRVPPPWSSLGSMRPVHTDKPNKSSKEGKPRETKAHLDLKKAALAREALKALTTSALVKGRGFSQGSPDFGQPAQSPLPARNPFRQSSAVPGKSLQTAKLGSSTTSHVESSRKNTSVKSLRPLFLNPATFTLASSSSGQTKNEKVFPQPQDLREMKLDAQSMPRQPDASSSRLSLDAEEVAASNESAPAAAPASTEGDKPLRRISTLQVPEFPKGSPKARDAACGKMDNTHPSSSSTPSRQDNPPLESSSRLAAEPPPYALAGVRRKSLKASDPIPPTKKRPKVEKNDDGSGASSSSSRRKKSKGEKAGGSMGFNWTAWGTR
ncbi:hypothetical protein HGRIS_013071 [Hohenbuehelia grisea]|uniref:Uncharacterized protein n=1 Tax=Hohenbuehelia grisea TaxID=104357 RepID=A0ABR3IUA5_9AGAR